MAEGTSNVTTGRRREPGAWGWALVLCAVGIEACLLRLVGLGAWGTAVPEFAQAYLTAFLFYLPACYIISRKWSEGDGGGLRWVLFAAGAGIVMRVTVLGVTPTLTEDLNRYRWHGKLQAAGGNPYTEAPEAEKWTGLRDATWPRVNRKELTSVYGPLYEHTYHLTYRLAAAAEPDAVAQVWWFKVPFVVAELGACAALAWLLAGLGLPVRMALIYWWSPLAVVEYWAQGHNDPLAVALMLVALGAAVRARWWLGYAALTLAALAKIWPVILFPHYGLRREEGRWRLHWREALVAVPIAVVVAWPFMQGIGNVEELLNGFAGGWRNNESLYGWIYEWAEEDKERGTELVKRILMVVLAGIWALQLPLVRAAKWSVVAVLFLAANCFPWYLGWFLPLLAVYPRMSLLVWTGTVVLAYQVLIPYEVLGIWRYDSWYLDWEYAPVYGLLAFELLWAGARWLRRRLFADEPAVVG